MGLSKYLMVAAAATMSVAPAIAAPANMASDSVRATAVASDAEDMGGSSVVLGLLAAAAIIAGIILLASNDSDSPTSP